MLSADTMGCTALLDQYLTQNLGLLNLRCSLFSQFKMRIGITKGNNILNICLVRSYSSIHI